MKTIKAISARAFLMLILLMVVSLDMGNAAPRDEPASNFYPAEILAKAHEFDVRQIKVEGKITMKGGKLYFTGMLIFCKHNAGFSKWLVKNYNLKIWKKPNIFTQAKIYPDSLDVYDRFIDTRNCDRLLIQFFDDENAGSYVISIDQFVNESEQHGKWVVVHY